MQLFSSHSVQSGMASSSDSEEDTSAVLLTDQQRYAGIWKELIQREFEVGIGELSEDWLVEEAETRKSTFLDGESKSKTSIFVFQFTVLEDSSSFHGWTKHVEGFIPEERGCMSV